VTADTLREIGWPGLTLRARLLVRPTITRLRAGERIAMVAVGGASVVRTRAVAARSVEGPSLGWRLRHLL
jgi:hypothetical protein